MNKEKIINDKAWSVVHHINIVNANKPQPIERQNNNESQNNSVERQSNQATSNKPKKD